MTYIVQPGDTLYLIAQRFNTTVDELIAVNHQIVDPDQIYPGQMIVIPDGVENCPFLRKGDRGPDVQRFQTLLKIARFNPGPLDGIFGIKTQAALDAFQHSVKELEPTGVADEETWVSLGAECGPRIGVTEYVVRPGDTLFIISARFNVTIRDIQKINPQLVNPNLIYSGQILLIPGNT